MRWTLMMLLAGLATGCGDVDDMTVEQEAQGLQSPAELMRCGIPGTRAIAAAERRRKIDFTGHRDAIRWLAPTRLPVINVQQRFTQADLIAEPDGLRIDVEVIDEDYFDIVSNTLVLSDAETGADLASFDLIGRCGFLRVSAHLPMIDEMPATVQLEWVMRSYDDQSRRIRRVVEVR